MGAEAENHQQKRRTIPNPNPNPNPISEAQYLAWKRRKDKALFDLLKHYSLKEDVKDADSSAKKDEATRKRAEDIAAGLVQMNGRELFVHEPWVFDNNLY